jgi:hypothetical protein
VIDAGHDTDITLSSRQLQTLFEDHSARIESIKQECVDAIAELQIA